MAEPPRQLWELADSLDDPVLDQLLVILGDKITELVDAIIDHRAGATDERFQRELNEALDEYVTDAAHYISYSPDGAVTVTFGFIDAADDKPDNVMDLKAELEQFVEENENDRQWHEKQATPGWSEALSRAKRLLEAWNA